MPPSACMILPQCHGCAGHTSTQSSWIIQQTSLSLSFHPSPPKLNPTSQEIHSLIIPHPIITKSRLSNSQVALRPVPLNTFPPSLFGNNASPSFHPINPLHRNLDVSGDIPALQYERRSYFPPAFMTSTLPIRQQGRETVEPQDPVEGPPIRCRIEQRNTSPRATLTPPRQTTLPPFSSPPPISHFFKTQTPTPYVRADPHDRPTGKGFFFSPSKDLGQSD